jgi:hypothetical protein
MATKKVGVKTSRAVGPNEKAVRAHLKSLEVSDVDDARGRLAITLAKALDNDAGMATAAVSRELRATLAELEGRDGRESDELNKWLAQLSAPMGNAENVPPHVRWETRGD